MNGKTILALMEMKSLFNFSGETEEEFVIQILQDNFCTFYK